MTILMMTTNNNEYDGAASVDDRTFKTRSRLLLKQDETEP